VERIPSSLLAEYRATSDKESVVLRVAEKMRASISGLPPLVRQCVFDHAIEDARTALARASSSVPRTPSPAFASPSSSSSALLSPGCASEAPSLPPAMAVPGRVRSVDSADLTCDQEKPTTPEKIGEEMKMHSGSDMKIVVGFCDEQPVSADFETSSFSSIRDAEKSAAAAAGTTADPDVAAEPREQQQQQQQSDPREVLKTMPWPSSVEEWSLLQSKIWSGHLELQRGWIRCLVRATGQV